TGVALLSALISPDATAVASALRKTVPPPHESLLTSIGLLDRVTLLVPGTPSVAVPPQLPLPLPGRLSAALTTRSPTGSMSMMPPPPPPVPPGRLTGAFTVTDPLAVKLSSSPPSPPPSLLFWLLPAAFPLAGPLLVSGPCTLASRMIRPPLPERPPPSTESLAATVVIRSRSDSMSMQPPSNSPPEASSGPFTVTLALLVVIQMSPPPPWSPLAADSV